MPKWLAKEYGPFTGGVWVVVIVGGVGLGLVMRKYFNRGDTAGEFAATSPAVGTTDPTAPAFAGGGTMFNQGEIVASVVEAINAQKPPPATTTPGPVAAPNHSAEILNIRQRIAGLKAANAALLTQYNNIKAAYQKTPTSQPNKRKELYAEMEANEHKRRANAVLIADLTAQIKALS